MFKSTVLLSIADVMTVTGYKRSRAGSIVAKVNAYTEKQGFITPRRGCCYLKAFAKLTGLTKPEILEALNREEGANENL